MGHVLPDLQTPGPRSGKPGKMAPPTDPSPTPSPNTLRCDPGGVEGFAGGRGGAHQAEPGLGRREERPPSPPPPPPVAGRNARRGDAGRRAGPERAPRVKERFTGERRGEEGSASLGPSRCTKEKPIPLLATDGARTQSGVARKFLHRPPRSLSNGEEGAGRQAARRGHPRPALGSTLTLILVASLFVT